jgi:16S rRNA (guanine1207-N2)-methyltransferase
MYAWSGRRSRACANGGEDMESVVIKPVTPDYRTEQIIAVEIGGQAVRLGTRAGFPAWGHVSPALELMAQHAQIESGQRVLVCPCGHGALGVWAATRTPAERVTLLDSNSIAVEAARRAASLNHCRGLRISSALPSDSGQTYDVALMSLPKGRDLTRLLLLDIYNTLREGGQLCLSGANDEGIKSAIKDAEALYGPSELLGYKGGCRAVRLTRGPTPPDGLPEAYRVAGLAAGSYHAFDVAVGGETLAVRSRPGVFSWRALDAGTRLLLDNLSVHVTERVLDVGCGYGIVGLWAGRRAIKGRVTWLDVDLLACESTRATLAANGATGHVIQGDGIAAAAEDAPYTLILSNPPFHSGHEVSNEVAEALILEAYATLEPRGRLVLVASRFLAYEQAMTAHFGGATTLAETPLYRVLSAEKLFQRKVRGRPTRRERQALAEETIYEVE